MKIITVEYKNSKGEWTNYFIDSVSSKKIMAGTISDVSEERAEILFGNNKWKIKFAKPYIEQSNNLALEEMTRDELFDIASELGLKVPKNTKTINLINKIIEKQNS